MKRLLLITGALALVAAAGPVLAADGDVELNGVCTVPVGAILVTPGTPGYAETVTTPLGVGNGFEEPVGAFYVDLAGQPVGTTADLSFVLSWDNPVADYDLVTGGDNELSTDAPESKTVSAGHCEALDVAVDVFLGTPLDVVDLTAEALLPETDA